MTVFEVYLQPPLPGVYQQRYFWNLELALEFLENNSDLANSAGVRTPINDQPPVRSAADWDWYEQSFF